MSIVPVRKCEKCNLYHDFTLTSCTKCNGSLRGMAMPLNTDEIPEDERGQINEQISVFVQVCSKCGAKNYTSDAGRPVRMCISGHPFKGLPVPEKVTFEAAPCDTNADSKENASPEGKAESSDDNETEQFGAIRRNIQSVLEGSEDAATVGAEKKEDAGWEEILGSGYADKKITLTAVNGNLTFSVKAQEGEKYMLGRSANQREFLIRDLRVGNEHCFLFYAGGFWHVKDNHSKNGTFVNGKDIGEDGEQIIIEGDRITLGHDIDSITFRIGMN